MDSNTSEVLECTLIAGGTCLGLVIYLHTNFDFYFLIGLIVGLAGAAATVGIKQYIRGVDLDV